MKIGSIIRLQGGRKDVEIVEYDKKYNMFTGALLNTRYLKHRSFVSFRAEHVARVVQA